MNATSVAGPVPETVCPWWMGYLLANPLRRLFQSPAKLLKPHVTEGMTVIEPGPGMGFFTLELAQRVGGNGRVVAVDLEPRMLRELCRRATKAGVGERVETRIASPQSLNLAGLEASADFALVFAVAHEVPDTARFFRELADASKTGARMLFSEPKGHVTPARFAQELHAARDAGWLLVLEEGDGLTALLEKR